MKRLALLILALLFVNCAANKIGYVKNLDFENAKYQKIGVLVQNVDIENRKNTEKIMVERFEKLKIDAVAVTEIIPPEKDYSEEELFALLLEKGITGIMIIDTKGASEGRRERATTVQIVSISGVPPIKPINPPQAGRNVPSSYAQSKVYFIDCKTKETVVEFDDYISVYRSSKNYYNLLGDKLISALNSEGFLIRSEVIKKY